MFSISFTSTGSAYKILAISLNLFYLANLTWLLFHELKDALTGTAAQELKEEDFCDCDGDDGVSGKDALSRSDSEAQENVSADGSSSDDESGNEMGPHLAMEEDEDLDMEKLPHQS